MQAPILPMNTILLCLFKQTFDQSIKRTKHLYLICLATWISKLGFCMFKYQQSIKTSFPAGVVLARSRKSSAGVPNSRKVHHAFQAASLLLHHLCWALAALPKGRANGVNYLQEYIDLLFPDRNRSGRRRAAGSPIEFHCRQPLDPLIAVKHLHQDKPR